MADSGDTEDVKAYISSSKYRLHVLDHLFEFEDATPKQIAESVNDRRPHVSRALSELREKGVVELRVPEARSVGRYYGLTPKGKAIWPEVRERTRSVEWSVRDPDGASERALADVAREEFGDSLRSVGVYDENGRNGVNVLYVDPDVRSQYTDREFEQAVRAMVLDDSLAAASMPNEACRAEVLTFTEFSVLKVLVDGGSRVLISFDNDSDVLVPEFADAVRSVFQGE